MRGDPPISSIYRHGQKTPSDIDREKRKRTVCETLYIECGLIVIDPTVVPPELARLARSWAVEKYGEGYGNK